MSEHTLGLCINSRSTTFVAHLIHHAEDGDTVELELSPHVGRVVREEEIALVGGWEPSSEAEHRAVETNFAIQVSDEPLRISLCLEICMPEAASVVVRIVLKLDSPAIISLECCLQLALETPPRFSLGNISYQDRWQF